MYDSQNQVLFEVIEPQLLDDATATANVVDTSDCGEVTFYVHLGDTDIALSALKVQESDTKTNDTTLASGADVTGTIYGTSADTDGNTSSLPSATDDNNVYAIRVKCGGSRKRYLGLVVTAGNGTTGAYVSAVAVKTRLKETPSTLAGRGLGGELIV